MTEPEITNEKERRLDIIDKIAEAKKDAQNLRREANEIKSAIDDGIMIIDERTSWVFLLPKMVVSVMVGALVASLVSLLLFVQVAANCTPGDDSTVCGIFAPENKGQTETLSQFAASLLYGDQFVSQGGDVETYLAQLQYRQLLSTPIGSAALQVTSDSITMLYISYNFPGVTTGSVGRSYKDAFENEVEEQIVYDLITKAMQLKTPQFSPPTVINGKTYGFVIVPIAGEAVTLDVYELTEV